MENVYFTSADSYEINLLTSKLESAFNALNVFNTLRPKMRVLILPTLLGNFSPDMAKNTHPNIICAIVNLLTKNGVMCMLASSPYGKYDLTALDKTYLETGLIDAENLSKFELNHDLSTTNIMCESGVRTKSLKLLGVINDVDAIVNVNKLIFDEKLGYCGATSNLFNLIPGELKTIMANRLPSFRDYYNFLLDMYEALKGKVKLNITDGVVSLEQNTQRMVSTIGVSRDSLALDAAILDMFSADENESIVAVADERRLISKDRAYKNIGDKLEKYSQEDYNTGSITLSTNFSRIIPRSKSYFRSHQRRVSINKDKCKGCQVCSKICPTGAISIELDENNERYAKINYEKCIFCNKCHTSCPYSIVDIKTPIKYKTIEKEIDKFNN